MPNKQQRQQNKANYLDLMHKVQPMRQCPNCLKDMRHGHFVPPSFGEEGFFICKKACECCGGTGIGPQNSNFAGLSCALCR